MDLPKCRTCGERHRLGGCPESQARATALADAKRREKSSSEAKGKPQTPAGSKTGDGLARNSSDGRTDEAMAGDVGAASGRLSGPKPASAEHHESAEEVGMGSERSSPSGAKFDRDAYHRNYMKEYMRKRRAAKK